MGVVGDFVIGKKDLKDVKKELDKMLVTNVHAPRKKSRRRSIVSKYNEEIDTKASTAKASITEISGQLDTAIKGQFRTKIETVLDNNSKKYDDI